MVEQDRYPKGIPAAGPVFLVSRPPTQPKPCMDSMLSRLRVRGFKNLVDVWFENRPRQT